MFTEYLAPRVPALRPRLFLLTFNRTPPPRLMLLRIRSAMPPTSRSVKSAFARRYAASPKVQTPVVPESRQSLVPSYRAED